MHVKNGSKDLQNTHKSAAELGAPSTLLFFDACGLSRTLPVAYIQLYILNQFFRYIEPEVRVDAGRYFLKITYFSFS